MPVPAIRLGEQGRGFAVVASEARSFAQRQLIAPREFRQLITQSIQKIQDGSRLANHADDTMNQVTQAVARVTHIMGEIAAALDEQRRGIEQASVAITQMNDVTQQNAALVEEAAAASKSLEDQASLLAHGISGFRLEASTSRA